MQFRRWRRTGCRSASSPRKLALDKSATPAGYGRQLTEVYLVNLETGTGRPARIVLGDPMPEMVRLLPEPGELGA
jgi:hypothetical protein